MALIAENLDLGYQKQTVLADVSLELKGGDMKLLMGPSGSGKSTLLKALAGLYPQYGGQVAGQIKLDDADLKDLPANVRAKEVGLLFQNPDSQFAMPTVRQEFIFALENLALPHDEIDRRIAWSLTRVGLADFIDRPFVTLSGGELQKVALAEVLALGAKYLLLDEPFAAVDLQSRRELQGMLHQLSQEGYGILVAVHDSAGYLDKITDFYQVQGEQLARLARPDWQKFEHRDQYVSIEPAPLTAPNYSLEDVSLKNGEREVLHQDQLAIYDQQITLITGPNGVGKSTLLKTLADLHDYQGTLIYENKALSKWKKRAYYRQVGLIFQSATEQFLDITVEEELAQVASKSPHADYWQADRRQNWLEKLGLTGMDDRSVYTLSGGQQKKLQLILMLIMAPKVLLMDEPLAGLDEASIDQVLTLIQEVQRELHLTVVVVSHQVRDLVRIIDQHLSYQDGSLTYQKEVAV